MARRRSRTPLEDLVTNGPLGHALGCAAPARIPMPEPRLEDQLRDLRAGDRAARDRALEWALEWALPKVEAYIRLNTGRHLRAREAHEDLVQTVCREVLVDVDGFRGESEAEFRAWVLRLAQRKIHARHRAQSAQCRDSAREVPLQVTDGDGTRTLTCYSSLATPSQALSVREQVAKIESAVEQLPEEQRRVLTMARVLGMPYGEIAEELGKSVPAVRKTVSRARARLALLLAIEDPAP